MQRGGGRSEPLTPLGEQILTIAIAMVVIYVVHDRAGGWRGVMHRRIRWPFLSMLVFGALGAFGRWLVERHPSELVSERVAALGGVLLVFSMIAGATAVLVTISRFRERRIAGLDIVLELNALLDPEREHFQVDATNAHQPLELLEQLSDLIGPGSWLPDHYWATHHWIAERMPAARELTMGNANPRRSRA